MNDTITIHSTRLS